MRAEIIAVGTELLLGHIVNTNAQYLSQELAALGIDVYFHTVVGDNPQRVGEAFSVARKRSDMVIFTGGLGPTQDDLTKETVAQVLGLELHMDEEWKKRLESFFASLKRPMPANNLKQAQIPAGSRRVMNNNGTAPGIMIEDGANLVLLLPGPPKELKPMFAEEVIPYLRSKLETELISSRVLRLTGIGESTVEEIIADLVTRSNPTIAPLVHNFEVALRITAKGGTEAEVESLLDVGEEKVRERLNPYIYGHGSDTLSAVVGRMLLEQGKTLAVAESCTGGLLGQTITSVSGSSRYFLGGLITYSNQLKESLLGVEEQLLADYGAVSRQVARRMAQGAIKATGADFSLAVTGVAGPEGGTEEKPVGLVHIALAGPGILRDRELFIQGRRETVRGRSVVTAIHMLWQELLQTSP